MARRCGLLSCVVLATAVLAAQELPPSATVQRSVNLIQVPTIVIDAYGRQATGLNPEDFEIRDNGKLQTIAQFQYVNFAQPQPFPSQIPPPTPAPANDDVADIIKPPFLRRPIFSLSSLSCSGPRGSMPCVRLPRHCISTCSTT